MKVVWELEGNVFNGDNVTLKTGTKTECKNFFKKMTEEEKAKYFFIALQPYSDSERLDFDETLYVNNR